MFGKLVKLPFKQSFRGLTPSNYRSFGGGSSGWHGPGLHSLVPDVVKYEEDIEEPEVLAEGAAAGDPEKLPNLKEVAHLRYRKYPNISHNDPDSPDYIHSERDEYHDSVSIRAYNYLIDRYKAEIKIQDEVYQIIENLDRPYKRGIPGVTRNITGGLRDYFPPEDLGFPRLPEKADEEFFDRHYNNKDRWANQALFTPKFAPIESDLEWQREYLNRPVTKHFHADKGYKYDVEVPYDQRYPHVADRRGYPEILGTPWERLLRLEGEIYHPTYLDQPFVQIPHSDPHPSLDFEEGEVVYENANLQEWAKFWNFTAWSAYAFAALFVPYNLLYKTHMPLPSAFDNLFVPYYTHTMYFWDSWTLHAPFIGIFACYTSYLSVALMNSFWKDYVVKMQYSKDKELLFVTRISPYCSLEEEVYEVHHLEVLPPSVKSGVADLSAQDEDGLWDITCLASHRNLVVSNEDKFWNPALRKDFFDKVMNFWTPDVVEPSRIELMKRAQSAPKIELGGSEQTDQDQRRLGQSKS